MLLLQRARLLRVKKKVIYYWDRLDGSEYVDLKYLHSLRESVREEKAFLRVISTAEGSGAVRQLLCRNDELMLNITSKLEVVLHDYADTEICSSD